jgi:hypothetical protein
MNQANPIITSHNATCFRIVNHLLYFSSSPAAVSIRNHQYNNINNAINANIPNIQFIAFCITLCTNAQLAASAHTFVVPGIFTHHTPIVHHRHVCAKVTHHNIAINHNNNHIFNFFIVYIVKNKVMYYCVINPNKKNIILTTNRASQINASPIPACFNILNHSLYFSSLPAAVTILNHPYNKMISAMSHNIPRTRFIKLLITFNKLSHCNQVPPGTSIPTCV